MLKKFVQSGAAERVVAVVVDEAHCVYKWYNVYLLLRSDRRIFNYQSLGAEIFAVPTVSYMKYARLFNRALHFSRALPRLL